MDVSKDDTKKSSDSLSTASVGSKKGGTSPIMIVKDGKLEFAKRYQCTECNRWFGSDVALTEHNDWEHPSAEFLEKIGVRMST